ncbi:MAG: hypothetical protein IJG33_07505 [Selenomonadaceae bacterium]|nr:hypothetical protein [Selenomonadaceae bacterium]
MAELSIEIKILSPIHLGSGQADVNIDSEIVHDAQGFPYFPAKRFKGLLYESALEVWEMFELSGLSTENILSPEEIFHRHTSSNVQLIVPNFFICPPDEYKRLCQEWQFLQTDETCREIFTPVEVLNSFTMLRYQTQLIDGVAAEGSLRNLRVLNAGIKFFGKVTLLNGNERGLNLLALAIGNISSAGMKRNRGFGRVECSATFDDGSTAKARAKKFFAKEA